MIYSCCEFRLSMHLKWFLQLIVGAKDKTLSVNSKYMFEASDFEPLGDSAALWDLQKYRTPPASLCPHGSPLRN